MTWARLGGDTLLRHIWSIFLPNDFWMQEDIWLPTQMGCGTPGFPGTGQTGYFIWTSGVQRGIGSHSGCSPTPCWRWSDGFTSDPSNGPTPLTTYTVGFHVHPHTPIDGSFDVDYYVNGVLAFTDAFVNFVGAFNFFYLNYSSPNQCCCNAVYLTNVKVGTTQGASDLFYEDFSEGNFNNWFPQTTQQGNPVLASLVDFPQDDPCPTVSITPTRGQPGDPITITGSGFNPAEEMFLSWRSGTGVSTPVEDFEATSDGAGNFSAMTVVPGGVGFEAGNPPTPMPITVYDALMRAGCGSFAICGNEKSDGIQAGWDNPDDQDPTYLPDPLVAIGGDVGSGTNQAARVFDYVFHDGAHWVLWRDPSAVNNQGIFNPIPTNHSMNATRISADGSSVVDYPIDTGYAWQFGAGNVDDPGLFHSEPCPPLGSNPYPYWSQISYFSSWSKPIYDAHFASDGTNLWVGIVTAESVPYPYIDNRDTRGPFAGGAAQATPLSALTSGFTTFATNTASGYFRYYANPTRAINQFSPSAFPLTDSGIEQMGVWNPPVVAMFVFSGGGFDRIGEIDALYCPSVIQQTSGYQNVGGSLLGGVTVIQGSPRGFLWSRVALAASENNPGVCHVVWSEGGDWGRVADGGGPCFNGSFGGSRYVWDAGAPTRSYRVNYTTWSPTAKLTDQDLFESHQDRTNWHFTWDWDNPPNEYSTGFTWPPPDQFGGLVNFDLRCDNANGDVLLFAAPSTLINLPYEPQFGEPSPDHGGNTWDDFNMIYNDTLQVYDITGGTAVLKQTITPDLLPNESETTWSFPVTSGGNAPSTAPPLRASDCLLAGPSPFGYGGGAGDYALHSVSPQAKGFGMSAIYADPLLGGTPVYLVHVPWARRLPDPPGGLGQSGYGNYHMRGFYRVPADMSAPFDFLDGERQLQFTVIGSYDTDPDVFGDGDFFSDPDNIWIPSVTDSSIFGQPGYWFDRTCKNRWQQLINAETPSDFFGFPGVLVGYAMCHGFNWDEVADSISFVSTPSIGPSAFAVTTLYFCRGCQTCLCGRGVHIAHRF